jgi:hypothetical protein
MIERLENDPVFCRHDAARAPIGLPSASRPGLGRSFLDFDISEKPLGTSLSLHLIELSTGFNSA